MPPLPGDNLRKILPSEFSIIYVLKSEYYKAIGLLTLIAVLSCIPCWILSALYIRDPKWYINNDLPYVWIFVRCFWNAGFLLALYHPIYHIKPFNLMCISSLILLIFDGFDTLFAYYYLHDDTDSSIDSTVTSFIIHEQNKNICNLFNCTFLNTYHFVLFVITFPLMNIFALILSIIYLKCFTVYGGVSLNEKKYNRDSFVQMSLSISEDSGKHYGTHLNKKLLVNPPIESYGHKPRIESIDETKYILSEDPPLEIPENEAIEATPDLCLDKEQSVASVATMNAEPCFLSVSEIKEISKSQLLLGDEAMKRIQERKSLKNPSIDSSHLQIWYESQVIRKRSLDDSILQMIQMETSDLPISKDTLLNVIWLSVLICFMLLVLFLSVFLWLFVNKKYLIVGWGGFGHYAVLLVAYGIFNGLFNKLTLRIDALRQYMYDISVQLLMELFLDSLYYVLYRYSLLFVVPLISTGDEWFHVSAFVIISLHLLFQILFPGFLFATETFYDLCSDGAIPWIFRKVLLVFNIYDDDDIIPHYNDWRERYSLTMIINGICCLYSFLAYSVFIIWIYVFGGNDMHDIYEGSIYIFISITLEIVLMIVINHKIFDGGMVEPFLRLYELNPLRLLLSIGVILAATFNVFGQTLFQKTLAGNHAG